MELLLVAPLRRGEVPYIQFVQGNFLKLEFGLFVYVRPVGGLQDHLC